MKKNKNKISNKQADGSIKFYSEEIKKSKTINEDTVKIITFIIILVIVLGLLFLLFFLNGKYVTKDKTETTTTTTETAYDDTKVTVNTMFGISTDPYYVLAYDKDDDINSSYYNNISLSFNNEKIKLYTLELNNAMNKKYYNKDKEQVLKDKNNINFTTNTLLVFKGGKISQVLTDKNEITNLLNKKEDQTK